MGGSSCNLRKNKKTRKNVIGEVPAQFKLNKKSTQNKEKTAKALKIKQHHPRESRKKNQQRGGIRRKEKGV